MSNKGSSVNVVSKWREIQFSDEDVVNVDEWIPEGDYNPRRVRPWLIHDHGFTLAVVFASCLEDALDEACDAGKLDPWRLDPTNPDDRDDYMIPRETGETRPDGTRVMELDWDDRVEYLGNASEPFDIDGLGFVELPNPARSFCAQFNAMG